MAKYPQTIVEAAKRIAKANGISVNEVFARYRAVIKKSAFSSADFLLPKR